MCGGLHCNLQGMNSLRIGKRRRKKKKKKKKIITLRRATSPHSRSTAMVLITMHNEGGSLYSGVWIFLLCTTSLVIALKIFISKRKENHIPNTNRKEILKRYQKR